MKTSVCLATLAFALALTGCHSDPNSVEDQVKVLLKSHRTREKLAAIDHLRKIVEKDPAAVRAHLDQLTEALKEPGEAKANVVILLAETKDPKVVPALLDAIDFGVGKSAEKADQEANRANKEIASALGELGDTKAVGDLIKLLKRTKDDYVRMEAITALGKLKDPQAVDALSDLATDDAVETLINKKAIMALGEIADARAMPAINKMLFRERRGVSFYPESSFALFEIGSPARDDVLKVLKGDDKALLKWAKDNRIVEGAIYAKAAQLVGDLQDQRAIPRLVQLLDYVDPEEKEQLGTMGAMSVMIRVQAADALGRLRAKAGVKPICTLIDKVSGSDIDDPNARNAYARALVMIGDRSAVPTLVACSKKGYWDARESCMAGLSRLGGEADAKNFDDFLKNEPALFSKECERAELAKDQCEATIKKHLEVIAAHKKRIDVMKGCGAEACLLGKLKSDDPMVRERAAYELGRIGTKAAIPALVEAIQRPAVVVDDLEARFAAISAVDWITRSSSDALASARASADTLNALLKKEEGKAMTIKIDEDVKRLVVKLRRKS
jgi:HEAT repeat protein